jgi:hypothetical protein
MSANLILLYHNLMVLSDTSAHRCHICRISEWKLKHNYNIFILSRTQVMNKSVALHFIF